MMKIIISLCAVIIVGSAVEQEVYKFSPETISKLKQIAMPCAKEFNIDPINIKKLGDKTISRDAATNKFLYCFGLNAGFLDSSGHIAVQRLATVVRNHPRAEEFKAVIKKCAQITKENPIATTVANHMCYAENAPILFEYNVDN